MKFLRPAGIRGAVEFARVFDDLETEQGQENRAQELLNSISAKIDINATLVKNMVRTLHDDYQVRLVTVLFARAFGEN
jgi:hypothetical protein